MTAPAWMPFYIADYLADTGHLSTLEHGAYLLLIMHYWQNGGLPSQDLKLARICRLLPKEWQKIKQTMVDLFDADWKHHRIDKELATAEETINKRSAAGKAGASARYGKRNATAMANAQQTNAPSPSPSPSGTNVTGAEAPLVDPEKELFDRGKQVLGKNAGGQISKLIRAKGGSIPLARAAIEQASTKQNPGEYIGAILRGRLPPDPNEAQMRVAL